MNDVEKSREELIHEVEVLRSIVAEFERVEEQRQRSENLRQIMLEISEAVHSASNLDELYRVIHRALGRAIYNKNFYIALYYEDTGLFSFPYAVDESGDEYDPRPHDLSNSMTAFVLRSGKPLLADKRRTEELAEAGEIRRIGSPAASWIGVPLITKGNVIGVMVVQSYSEEILFDESDAQVMSFVSEQIATAIERKRGEDELAAAYQRMRHDLRMASRVQNSMLPQQPPSEERLEFAWIFSACDEIAGDMFNVFYLDERHIGLYVLDVAGHGMQAALLSVTLNHILSPMPVGSGLLRRKLEVEPFYEIVSPAEVASILNRQFPISLETNQFFTLLYGILDRESSRFRFVRAGHTQPIVVRHGEARYLDGDAGPSIGIVSDARYEEQEYQLEPGDRLILHTDGVEEALNLRMEEFGRDRVTRVLAQMSATPIDEMVRTLHASVGKHTRGAPQSDDITILGIGRKA